MPRVILIGAEAGTGASLGRVKAMPRSGNLFGSGGRGICWLIPPYLLSGFQGLLCCQIQWFLCCPWLTLHLPPSLEMLQGTTQPWFSASLWQLLLCFLCQSLPFYSSRLVLSEPSSCLSSSAAMVLHITHVLVAPKFVSQAQMPPMWTSLLVLTGHFAS